MRKLLLFSLSLAAFFCTYAQPPQQPQQRMMQGVPNVIMDNLYADNKVKDMIIVMPNGRALKNDKAEGNIYSQEAQQ